MGGMFSEEEHPRGLHRLQILSFFEQAYASVWRVLRKQPLAPWRWSQSHKEKS